MIRTCSQSALVSESGEQYPVDSGGVNLYLKEAMGNDFTAKDFRTWGATLRETRADSAVVFLHCLVDHAAQFVG